MTPNRRVYRVFLLMFITRLMTVHGAILNLDLGDYGYDTLGGPEEEPYEVKDSENRKSCMCVPFWQCKEEFNGGGDLDVRKRSKVGARSEGGESVTCTGYFDVCCKVECGVRQLDVDKRILGTDQNTASFGEFPWMLGILKGEKYKCGASLIHPKIALTAAHCVAASPGQYKVRAGEWHWENTDEPAEHQDRKVERVLLHPHFHGGSLKNDIALLVLNSPFQLSSNVGVVCLPPKNHKLDVKRCTASGWGRNSMRKGSYQSVLKKVSLPIVSNDRCAAVLRQSTPALGPFFTLHGSFICAGGEPNKDTCKGDGGSPLVCPVVGREDRYEQVGIVSWGLSCGMTEAPGVYVNVVMFAEWIDGEMEKLGLDTDIYKYY
ncbi:phenoloxidase-activating factor 2-like [Anthonomus grandis grandis]|uniref:phenoloxidase-activating factor 2-like n=1 Tax=Anthonomus grandis grandis TaxID=2921223 RepID=UPI0021655F06|nr:phenoloxidase-activating factor 2-like [Anthonomus grandis grandis]